MGTVAVGTEAPCNELNKKPSASYRPGWQEIGARFDDPRECLASFLALEGAEVIDGVKPANLISIANRSRACGRNPYLLWKEWGEAVLAGSGLAAFELCDRGESALVLLYSPTALDKLLTQPAVAAVLKKAGYGDFSAWGPLLDELASRVVGSNFPHEIGVFLGYPLKDVAAFMGLVRIPYRCQGGWKIYGDPRKSLQLDEMFRSCRRCMAWRLAGCVTPFDCLHSSHTYVA